MSALYQPTAGLFPPVHNLLVTGGTYHQTNNFEARESGLQMLSQAISTAAMHDSSERYPPPKCHPETRKKVVDKVMAWVRDPDPSTDVLWLHAPFGHGKSAIMQTISETLQELGLLHLFAGSFFFGRGKRGRDNPHYVIPTIAYQIANNVPGMREHINSAMQADPSLPSKSIDIQLTSLVIIPFQHCSEGPHHTPTVVIDGLDECGGPDSQRAVLNMVAKATSTYHTPLRFLIASRPEAHIIQAFSKAPLSVITLPLKLDDDYEANEEMKVYLRSGFDEIYERREDAMTSVAKPWPDEFSLSELVGRASGQYLYASTVLAFIGSEYHNPKKQLEIILSRLPQAGIAFSSMDALVTQILELCPQRETTLRLLSVLLLSHRWAPRTRTLAALGGLLDVELEEVRIVLRPLNALVVLEDPVKIPEGYPRDFVLKHRSQSINIRHESFREFLVDEKRAGEFFIALSAVRLELVARADILLADALIGRLSDSLHGDAWSLVNSLLTFMSFEAEEKLLVPRLNEFLTELLEGRHRIPDKPSHDSFMALDIFYVFLMILFNPSVTSPFNIEQGQNSSLALEEKASGCMTAYRNLLDDTYRRTVLFTPAVQKVIQHVKIDGGTPNSPENISSSTFYPMNRVFAILDENEFMFRAFFRPSSSEWSVDLNEAFYSFIENETRSGLLHLTYRECRLLSFKDDIAGLADSDSRTRDILYSCSSFLVDTSMAEIRPETDFQSNSAMISLLAELKIRVTEFQTTGNIHALTLLLIWLCCQHRFLRSMDPKFADQEIPAGVEETITNVLQNGCLTSIFSTEYYYFPKSDLRNKPGHLVFVGNDYPPCEMDGFKVKTPDFDHQDVLELYFQLSDIWNESIKFFRLLSPADHTAVSEFFIQALVSCVYKGVHLDLEDRMDFMTVMANEVRWKEHLSRSTFSKKILVGLLTLHYITTKPDYLLVPYRHSKRYSDTVEQLPSSFGQGAIEWLKVRRRRYPVLERWCQQLLLMKERNAETRQGLK